MSPDLVFIVTYNCPRCRATLETRAESGPPDWLRCPKCGRASLPPEHVRTPPKKDEVDDDVFVIGPDARSKPWISPNSTANPTGHAPSPLPIRPRSMAARPVGTGQGSRTQTTRLILGTGFFLTTFLFLFSLLEQSLPKASLFGVVAAFLLFLLSRPSPPEPREPIHYP